MFLDKDGRPSEPPRECEFHRDPDGWYVYIEGMCPACEAEEIAGREAAEQAWLDMERGK